MHPSFRFMGSDGASAMMRRQELPRQMKAMVVRILKLHRLAMVWRVDDQVGKMSHRIGLGPETDIAV
jgi:hypothetical protein